jgi:hypothetical protein
MLLLLLTDSSFLCAVDDACLLGRRWQPLRRPSLPDRLLRLPPHPVSSVSDDVRAWHTS